jgi:lipopolysaccharide transport system permease protein
MAAPRLADSPPGGWLTDASASRRRPQHLRDLVWHLARAELDATHRMTVLGWLWPLVRQLAQLVILVFVFSHILNLGIKDFPVFVFSGLIAWNWFSAGVSRASTSLLDQRHLLFQPRFPAQVVPIVAIFVPLLDVFFALPVLLAMMLLGSGLTWDALALPLLILLQLILMAGLAWGLSAASVFFRDTPNLVGIVLLLMFYLTPVFYNHARISGHYGWVLRLNPMAIIIDATRSILLSTSGPSWSLVGGLTVLSVVIAVGGYAAFSHVQSEFVDHL